MGEQPGRAPAQGAGRRGSDAEGAKVELVRTPEGVLVKAKRQPKPRYRLSDLLAGITAHNVHPETDWGPSVGKEIVE